MKFRCDKNVILKEISIAQDIVSSRNALSILSNVLLEADNNSLTIKATDLKVGFETVIPVDLEEAGSTTIYCDKFLGIIKSLPNGTITFEQVNNEKMVIHTDDGNISFQLNTIDADKFPELLAVEENSYFELPQKMFMEMISHTIFSISDDETRYFMNGVFMEREDNNLVMVGTDGRRLSYIGRVFEGSLPDFSGIIVPPKILQLIKKLASGEGNIQIAVIDKSIFVRFDNQKISSSLIDGQFPNYRKVIPENQDNRVVISKSDLSSALRRVSILAEHKSKKIFLTVEANQIVLKSEESDVGTAKEIVSCSYDGPETTFALNYTYLIEPLNVIDEDNILLLFTEKNRAVTLQSDPEKDYLHVVMPMQMD
jgi:DNA polymerase III subunit beta